MAREYPAQPLPSCQALVKTGGQILLVQRARPPLAGYWSLPGGGVELGETAAEAIIREVREETGITVSVSRFLGYADAIDRDADGRVQYHYLILYFEARAESGSPRAGDDAAKVAWVSEDEVWRLPLTDSVRRSLAWSGEPTKVKGDET